MFGRVTPRGLRPLPTGEAGRAPTPFDSRRSSSTREREAYFLDYVERIRARTKLPLMLTGGFRTAEAMTRAIEGGAVDVVGLARPLIVEPDLPRRLIGGTAAGSAPHPIRVKNRVLDDLVQATWYARQVRRMARGAEPDPTLGRWSSLVLEAPRAYAFNPFKALLPRPRRRRALAEATDMPSRRVHRDEGVGTAESEAL
jgi:hypothetical protein